MSESDVIPKVIEFIEDLVRSVHYLSDDAAHSTFSLSDAQQLLQDLKKDKWLWDDAVDDRVSQAIYEHEAGDDL